MSYSIKLEAFGVVVHLHGRISTQEIQSANTEVRSWPRWRDRRYEIWDFLNAESLDVTYADVDAVIAQDNQVYSVANQAVKIAFIARLPEIIRICDYYVQEVDVGIVSSKVFDDASSARTWATR